MIVLMGIALLINLIFVGYWMEESKEWKWGIEDNITIGMLVLNSTCLAYAIIGVIK